MSARCSLPHRLVAAPQWTGGNATTTASNLIGSDTTATTSSLLATQSSGGTATGRTLA